MYMCMFAVYIYIYVTCVNNEHVTLSRSPGHTYHYREIYLFYLIIKYSRMNNSVYITVYTLQYI